MNKIILKIGYSCNHKCDFCHAEINKKNIEKETLKTIKKIFHIKKNLKDIDTILLSGGEPTILDNFFKLLKIISSLGFKTGVITNGSMIYRKEFLEKCLGYNFNNIYLSIHGGKNDIHNIMTGTKESFSQIKELLENLNRIDFKGLSINCVVTKNNINYLEDVITFIKKFNFTKIKFSLLEPKGLGLINLDNLYVSPEIVAKHIIELIKKYSEINIGWDGLPLCLLQGYEKNMSNLQTEKIMYMSETFEDKIYETDYGVREFAKKCSLCSLKKSCYGNFKIYNKLYGINYLKSL